VAHSDEAGFGHSEFVTSISRCALKMSRFERECSPFAGEILPELFPHNEYREETFADFHQTEYHQDEHATTSTQSLSSDLERALVFSVLSPTRTIREAEKEQF